MAESFFWNCAITMFSPRIKARSSCRSTLGLDGKALALGLLWLVAGGAGGAPAGRALGFATRDQLFMAIGKYEPGKGWYSYEGFTRPTQPGDVFTLYTMAG